MIDATVWAAMCAAARAHAEKAYGVSFGDEPTPDFALFESRITKLDPITYAAQMLHAWTRAAARKAGGKV